MVWRELLDSQIQSALRFAHRFRSTERRIRNATETWNNTTELVSIDAWNAFPKMAKAVCRPSWLAHRTQLLSKDFRSQLMASVQ